MRTCRPCLLVLAVLATAGAFLHRPARLQADEGALAADIVPSKGLPPFQPAPEARATPESLEAWIERVTQAGRARAGTGRGAELLYSAASAELAAGGSAERARQLFLEAHQGAPDSDPLSALAALQILRIANSVGSSEHARQAAAWLERWERTNAPLDADEVTASRFALVAREMAGPFQVEAATVLEGLGRFGGAALRLETLAQADPPRLNRRLPPLWERAAVDRARAGEPEAVRDDVAKALAAEPTPEERARLLFWLLHWKHGLLTTEARFGLTGAWPGEAYLADLDETLRDLSCNVHVSAYLLSAASSALAAKADADALALYLRALDDPALRQRALSDADMAERVLPAVPAAVRLGRFEEAERILVELERLAGGPLRGADQQRAAVKLAREEASRSAAVRGPGPPGPPAPSAARPPPSLDVPRPASESAREQPPALPPAQAPSPFPWLPVLAGGALLLLLAARARHRPR